jgi:hypothetical protein
MLSLKDKIHLSIIREIELRDYERFLSLSKFVEDAFEAQQKLIEKEVDVLLKETKNEQDEAMLVEFFYEDLSLFKDRFPSLQRNTLMVSLVSMEESNMTRLCLTYGKLFLISEVFNTYKPGIINRSLKYLEVNTGIQTSKFVHSISLVKNLVLIRNAIIHSQGSLEHRNTASTIRQFIKNKKYLGVDRHDRIILKKGSIEHYSKEMHKFNIELQHALTDKLKVILENKS